MTSPTSSTSTPAFSLSNKNYNRLKVSAQLLLPAVGALYFAIAQIWGLPAAEEVTGTVAAVNVFAGVAVQWLKSLHNASGAQYDGVLMLEDGEDGSQLRLGQLDMNALFDKDDILFKIVRPPTP
jgi:hypothetical protein